MSLVGKQLGKYHILKPLGRGGMSRVYQAYHPQLDRYVAVKIMRQDLVDDEQFAARFQHEAQAVARLRHPNIVQVHDFDIEDDITYMVMELLDGDSLKTRLIDYRVRGEKMPYGEIASIMLNVLDGLAYAHDEGMIHRDIKPANILLTQKGQAVLADFGIAQIIGSTRHTMSGALMGTLAYMAPEQGLKGEVNFQTDLYSMGIVFYEMLAQEPPYDADTPLAVLMKHLNDPLPLDKLEETAVPLPFQNILMKALAKNPQHRHQTAAALSDHLQQAVAECGIILPDKISPPMTFTTPDAPSESVAIHSGSDRQALQNATFANDETNPTLNSQYIADLKAKEAADVEPVGAPFHETAVSWQNIWKLTPSQLLALFEGKFGHPRNNFILMLAGWNAAGVLLCLIFDRWDIYGRGWTFQLFIYAWGLAGFYRLRQNRWIYFRTLNVVGWGWLLTYSAIFEDWGLWADIWPAAVGMPLLSFVIVFFTQPATPVDDPIQNRLTHLQRFALLSAAAVFAMALAIIP